IREAVEDTGYVSDIKVFPLADGGEGTVEALMSCMHGKEIEVEVTGPLGEKVSSYYGVLEEEKLAVMEMANVAGITMVADRSKNPMNTTTYGVGEMILDAANRGCREFIIGIGGSATNDGGLGMLTALGVEFYNKEGKKAGIFGRDVMRVDRVDTSHLAEVLKECHFTIMCDVTNPLCGEMGSSAIYGPQKGATAKTIVQMDEGLKQYAEVIRRDTGKDFANAEGAGAAGGLGFAFLTFLNTTMSAGISYILDKLGLDEEMKDADIVITGEGKLDAQTAMGKAPAGVAAMAKKHGALVLGFTGATSEDAEACNKAGMDAYFSICRGPMSMEEAMDKETARQNIHMTVKQVFNLIHQLKKG
ncbi:MAG: glycerate kinase, partial [Lachnospiraceae bacterium]|nr:glycerate kinase [Lachnospiraceae bacterium]